MKAIWNDTIIAESNDTILVENIAEPLNPSMTVLFKFRQEILFVASLGNVPDLIGNIMSFRPCHQIILYRYFSFQKSQYRGCFGPF